VSPTGKRELYVNPALPDWLPELTITNLRAGGGAMDLRFHGGEVEALRNSTGYRIVRAPAPRPAPPPFTRTPKARPATRTA